MTTRRIDFYSLVENEKQQVVERAMRNENISWKDTLVQIYPMFKDKAFVSDLIQ